MSATQLDMTARLRPDRAAERTAVLRAEARSTRPFHETPGLRPPLADPGDARRVELRQGERRRAEIIGAVADLVVTRLVLAHRKPAATPEASAFDVAGFARSLIEGDDAAIAATVAACRTAGYGVERIYLDLIGGADRLLASWGAEDRRSEAEVALGRARLLPLLHGLRDAFLAEGGRRPVGQRVLAAPMPGEPHDAGVAMLSDFFRRAGFSVADAIAPDAAAILARVAAEPHDAVVLWLTSERLLAPTIRLIRLVRRQSCNRRVAVLVGGPYFAARPGMTALIGADALAASPKQAVANADRLLALLADRR